MSHRVRVPRLLGAVPALSLAACGTTDAKAPDGRDTPAAARTAGGSCPAREPATRQR
ncbi:hypothetical protein [Streptomyces sp. NPDC060322]|uniref:hypothetical protein n=1 Tax=Streptomyces sp. NPDC060322 TaxID=3347097 RepID=UPI003661930E